MSYCDSVVKIATLVPKEECLFQLPGQNLCVQLVFIKNSTDVAGRYGGVIENCNLTLGLDSYSSGGVFDMMTLVMTTQLFL